MKHNDFHDLWRDCLDDATPADVAGDMLAHALHANRRRQRARHVRRALAACAVIVVAIFALRSSPPPSPPLAVPGHVARPYLPPSIHSLTDDELLDHFPGEAVAIVGAGDDRRFVFLPQQ